RDELLCGGRHFAGMKFGPGTGFQIAQERFLPGELGMSGEEGLGEEIISARMAQASDEAHALGHSGIGGFALDGATGIERSPFPKGNAACAGFNVTTERALIRPSLVLERINV